VGEFNPVESEARDGTEVGRNVQRVHDQMIVNLGTRLEPKARAISYRLQSFGPRES